MTKQNFCRRLLTHSWDDLFSISVTFIVPFSLVDRKPFYVGQPWRSFSALGLSVDL